MKKTDVLINLFLLLLWCLPGSLFALSDLHKFSKVPISHHFTNNDYIGGIQNWAVGQNEQGVLFVANSFGLLEFDGVTWRTHNVPQITRMLSLYISNENTIYAGGQNQLGYFQPGSNGYMEYTSLLELLPVNERIIDDVWKVVAYEDHILFGSNEAVYVYDGSNLNIVPFENDGGYLFKVSNRVFAYSPTDGILEWNNGKFTTIKNGGFFAGKSVIEIIPYMQESLLVFQSDGNIDVYNNGQISSWKHDQPDLLQSALINTAYLLSSNDIAVGTQNNGLILFKPNGSATLHLTKRKGLNSNTVLGVFEDKFQNLWISQSNGLTYLETGSPFSLIDETLGVPGTGYAAALQDDILYLGTNNGLFYQNSKPQLSHDMSAHYQLVPGTVGQVYSIENQNQSLLMGHHRGGFEIINKSSEHFFDKTGVWKYHWHETAKKYIMGTYQGFSQFDSPMSEVLPFYDFTESSRLFEFENDSTLWMSHGYKGVFRIRFDSKLNNIRQVSYYNEGKGFPSSVLINVFRLHNQLYFPAETGVYQYEEASDRFVLNHKFSRLFEKKNHISALRTTANGDIYFIADNRFGVLKPDAFNQYEKIIEPFNPINKFISDNLENITIVDHENILIGAKEGFIHYNPSFIKIPNDKFDVLIRSIVVREEKDSLIYAGNIPLPKKLSFTKDVNSIRFQFAAPYFDGHQANQYRYRLENFETEWSEWSSTNQKEYTNLHFGSYTFLVEAKNIYGVVSHRASLPFRFVPPWYLTNIAFGFYITLIFMVFGIALYWLDSKHRMDKKKMEIDSTRRLHKKNLEIEEISKSSSSTIAELKNEKLKSEVEFKNKELVSTTMHLVNKNEFMVTLRSKLDTLIKNGQPKADEIKRIIKTINQNIDEDENWDQFTMHFDQVHGDFLNKLKSQYQDLSPQDIKLAAYLRMNLTSKDIAQLLSISVRGVEIGRYRLRKKLNLDRNTNLVTFMMNL